MLKRTFTKRYYILFLLVSILLFAMSTLGDSSLAKENKRNPITINKTQSQEVMIPSKPLKRKIILQREYLDGDVSEETIIVEILAMEDLWAQYRDWQLVDQNENRMIFKKTMDDISPLLKANGYFGITEDGTLSIFNGRPDSADIIQSFFQIDVEKLEGLKYEELKHGIRILDKHQYVQVLEAFKPYSVLGIHD
ncbi:intercompartmental signaling factor BofC [Peribacillus alkalitolerans]|uniref:intercompartmental signaling factor BofC n=1 Tax=Peribacillus alkalitolerans TaxID=1550385 RepID=UPI001F07EAB0|nr:intercompartmental signaling factor BofC [Peribacillus alkalitolerans]